MMVKSGDNRDSFMARLCLPAMNAINEDFTFTAEVASDFVDKRLPTLDFSLWMKDKHEVSHRYYEKEMKTQLMLEKDLAMSVKQKYTFLTNELTRRLYNIDDEEENKDEEVERTMEQMTKQLKNSGWNRKDVREMITSEYIGWKRRLERRKGEGKRNKEVQQDC